MVYPVVKIKKFEYDLMREQDPLASSVSIGDLSKKVKDKILLGPKRAKSTLNESSIKLTYNGLFVKKIMRIISIIDEQI